jgi:hypothetical protein
MVVFCVRGIGENYPYPYIIFYCIGEGSSRLGRFLRLADGWRIDKDSREVYTMNKVIKISSGKDDSYEAETESGPGE